MREMNGGITQDWFMIEPSSGAGHWKNNMDKTPF